MAAKGSQEAGDLRDPKTDLLDLMLANEVVSVIETFYASWRIKALVDGSSCLPLSVKEQVLQMLLCDNSGAREQSYQRESSKMCGGCGREKCVGQRAAGDGWSGCE